MYVSRFEWDEGNLGHATRHGVTVDEIQEAVRSATKMRPAHPGFPDRRKIMSRTAQGRPVVVMVRLLDDDVYRVISAWRGTR